jgi:hypothetical protein
MNMKAVAATIIVILVLALPATVLALAEESFGNSPHVKQPEWADGVIDVVNLKSRVYSFWVNGNETFFYRGGAKEVNEALRKYAEVRDDVRRLILLPGTGKTQSFDKKPIPFTWKFHVPSGIYRAVSKQTHAVMTVYIPGTRPRPWDKKQVDKWLGDLQSDTFKVREQATHELEKLGNDVKPHLREALRAQPEPCLEARRRIESLLSKLRDLDITDLDIPKGITVVTVDDLVELHLKGLKDADSTRSGLAVQELSALTAYSDKIVPAITDMLAKGKHEWVRRVAAGCLSHAGTKAKMALPALKQGLDDPDANVRNAFQAAIAQIENAKEAPVQDDAGRTASILRDINELKNR